MLETVVLLTFAAMLFIGILSKLPLYIPLSCGLGLFVAYGLIRGHKPRRLMGMAAEGLRSIGPVLQLFLVIGMLTSAWRACGTIAAITCYSSYIITPQSLVVISFLLCSAMSFITGSSFASAATIGVICMTIATAMGANYVLVGGAVISGAFFGDRTSPLSTTVNLVSTLTHTDVFNNVDRLLRIGFIPYLLCILIYTVSGILLGTHGSIPDFFSLFQGSFNLSPVAFLPTVAIIVLSCMKVPVIKTMIASLAIALVLCVTTEHIGLVDLGRIMVFGYTTENAAIAHMVDGGGILSMGPVALIVCIASTYSGLFAGTGLLNNLQIRIKALARRTTPFIGVLATSLLTTLIACDQILSIMLTKQLCNELEYGGEALALDLCNSASIITGFVPWSTVCVGLLAFLEAKPASCLLACYTYLIPLWMLGLSLYLKAHPDFIDTKFAQLMGIRDYDDARRFIERNAE